MSGKKTVGFDFFIGKSFVLTGVGSEQQKLTSEFSWRGEEDATAFSFILNGQCYTAMEDPSDGYRSSLSEIFVSDGKGIKNTFAPVKVIGRKCANENHDVVELVDMVTGKVVIEVGTCNTDDYYPGFVGNFLPVNMVLNESAGDRELRENLKAQAVTRIEAQVETKNDAWGSW